MMFQEHQHRKLPDVWKSNKKTWMTTYIM